MLMRGLLELLTPVACLSCGQGDRVLCVACLQAVARRTPSCPACNALTPDGRVCGRCRHSWALRGVTAPIRYDGAMRELIIELKTRNDRERATLLAGLIFAALPDRSFDLVTAVPTSRRRRQERGHNPAELIGRELARLMALPFRETALRTNTVHQIGQGRRERFRQIRGVFVPYPGVTTNLRVLIVDDVMTTGATLDELSRSLKESGAAVVWGAVAARR